MLVRLSLLLLTTAVAGCQCNLDDSGLDRIPDAGTPQTDAGTPPPPFPLKIGDQLRYPGIGGRSGEDGGGGSDRVLNAIYSINGVGFDEDELRWNLNADVLYQGVDDTITAATIAPLILSKAAPFDQVTVATPLPVDNAQFTTDAAPTDELTPNGFPFFQADSGNAAVLESAGARFCERFTALDPEVTADDECDFSTGERAMEVFFKDERAGTAKLHKVRAEYHQMGFVCGWDELMIPFVEGMQREQADFQGSDIPDLAMIFAGAPRLTRDGVEYNCSCFSQTCQSTNGTNQCLTTDPDADPVDCE